MKTNSIKRLCVSAVLTGMYVAIALVLAPLSFGPIQVRIAEALTLLPALFASSIPALTLGCALTNLIGAMMGLNILGFLDVFFGTFATFISAICSYKCRNVKLFDQPLLSALMPVLFNSIMLGAELSISLFSPNDFFTGFTIYATQIAIGESIACFCFGLPLIHFIKKSELIKRFGLD